MLTFLGPPGVTGASNILRNGRKAAGRKGQMSPRDTTGAFTKRDSVDMHLTLAFFQPALCIEAI